MQFFLTYFSSESLVFSSQQTGSTGSAQWALSARGAFQLCFSSNCSRDLYLWGEGRFSEVEDPSTVDPHPTVAPLISHQCIRPPLPRF